MTNVHGGGADFQRDQEPTPEDLADYAAWAREVDERVTAEMAEFFGPDEPPAPEVKDEAAAEALAFACFRRDHWGDRGPANAAEVAALAAAAARPFEPTAADRAWWAEEGDREWQELVEAREEAQWELEQAGREEALARLGRRHEDEGGRVGAVD
jgi:hypothetical protein